MQTAKSSPSFGQAPRLVTKESTRLVAKNPRGGFYSDSNWWPAGSNTRGGVPPATIQLGHDPGSRDLAEAVDGRGRQSGLYSASGPGVPQVLLRSARPGRPDLSGKETYRALFLPLSEFDPLRLCHVGMRLASGKGNLLTPGDMGNLEVKPP